MRGKPTNSLKIDSLYVIVSMGSACHSHFLIFFLPQLLSSSSRCRAVAPRRPLLPVAVLLACAAAGAARAPRLCAALLLPLACSQGGGHGRRQCRSGAREGGRPTVGFERIETQEGGVELGLFQISNLSLT